MSPAASRPDPPISTLRIPTLEPPSSSSPDGRHHASIEGTELTTRAALCDRRGPREHPTSPAPPAGQSNRIRETRDPKPQVKRPAAATHLTPTNPIESKSERAERSKRSTSHGRTGRDGRTGAHLGGGGDLEGGRRAERGRD
jgi:hypothetical protein